MELLLTPTMWAIILLLSAAGTALSFAKYGACDEGLDEILERYPKMRRDQLDRITGLFDRHGQVILLLSGIPGLDTIVA